MLPVNFPSNEVIVHWWARSKVKINYRDDDGVTRERRVVDYKVDKYGLGAFFIVGTCGRGVNIAHMTDFEEVYKIMPRKYRPSTSIPEDAHNIDGHTGRFSRDNEIRSADL